MLLYSIGVAIPSFLEGFAFFLRVLRELRHYCDVHIWNLRCVTSEETTHDCHTTPRECTSLLMFLFLIFLHMNVIG